MRAGLAAGRNAARDLCLFELGISTGFRIRELLSLRLRDVVQAGRVVDVLLVRKRSMKGGRKRGKSGNLLSGVRSRSVPLVRDVRLLISQQVEALRGRGYMREIDFVFQDSRFRNRAITPNAAWKILHAAARRQGITGKIGTHSMRKTFALRLYEWLQNNRRPDGGAYDALRIVSKALGHESIDTTLRYLAFDDKWIADAVFGAFGSVT